MRKMVLSMIIIIVFSGCKEKKTSELPKVGGDNLQMSQKQINEQLRVQQNEQILKEKKEKYWDMLSVNRKNGDLQGLWYITGDDFKKVNSFLGENLNYSDGYCMKVAGDLKTANLYFAVTEKIFSVMIEQIDETKYSMIYNNKKRVFQIVKLGSKSKPDYSSLTFFYEDEYKYNPKRDASQLSNGGNYYDFCVFDTQYDCDVNGCLKRIKDMDSITNAEQEDQPLGVE